ncbi:MAG: DUF721 domain-containing protein [Limnoraphis robusta]|jgi:predicted nucleic acid-binding Zn ribbon protein
MRSTPNSFVVENKISSFSDLSFFRYILMQSLNQVLGRLHIQLLTPEQQQFQSTLDHWAMVVGQRAIAHTRPVSINRGVLIVATSSAAWSQQLTFKRSQILRQLNQRLSNPLNDIKFSTALWHGQGNCSVSAEDAADRPQNHPSYITDIPPSQTNALPTPVSPQTAFANWAEMIQRRSQSLPECPQCHCPTPPGELKRWSVCAMCFSQQPFQL